MTAIGIACESDTPISSGGCCVDGRSCTDNCIEVVAAYECRESCGPSAQKHDALSRDGPMNDEADCCTRGGIDGGQGLRISGSPRALSTKIEIEQGCKTGCCAIAAGADSDDEPSKPKPKSVRDKSGSEFLEKPPPRNAFGVSCQDICIDEDLVSSNDDLTGSYNKKCCDAGCSASMPSSELPSQGSEVQQCDVGGAPTLISDCADNPVNPDYKSASSTGNGDQIEKIDVAADCVSDCCKKPADFPTAQSTHKEREYNVISSPPATQSEDRACSSHLQVAYEKYESYIKLGRCICRSVLGTIDVCCSRSLRNLSNVDCSNKRQHPQSSIGTHSEAQTGDQNPSKSRIEDPREQTECSNVEVKRCQNPQQIHTFDIEKLSSDESAHVLISISGMTCTGCANTGVKVLTKMTNVKNAHINFTASTGGFDVDSSEAIPEILARFEKDTGFKCHQITGHLQELYVQMPKVAATAIAEQLGKVVDSFKSVDRDIYCLAFDPTIIGARDLLSRLPNATLSSPKVKAAAVRDRKRILWKASRLILAALLTIPVVVLAWSKNSVSYTAKSIVSVVLATCVQILAIPEFYAGALRSLLYNRTVEMDMLVVISITSAYIYSIVAFIFAHRGTSLKEGELWETSTLLITLVMLGRLMTEIARVKALKSVSAKSLQSQNTLLIDASGDPIVLDARLLQYGDLFKVPPHTAVVTDGIIVSGASTFNESMLTGESLPIRKGPGDSVIAGAMNDSTPVVVRLTRLPGRNSITDIMTLVEDALIVKPRVQDLADTIAGWFVPAVLAIATTVFIIWLLIGIEGQHNSAGGSIGIAITYAIAVLAISCPCALALAVPTVLIVAGGVAAKSGIVIKQASVTEGVHRTTDMIFDKTGTLTTGTLEVSTQHFLPRVFEEGELSTAILSLLKGSSHPVSIAITRQLELSGIQPCDLDDVVSIPGAGLQAIWQGQRLKAGNPTWLGLDEDALVSRLLEEGVTIFCVTVDSCLVAVFGLISEIRPEAKWVIQCLHRRNITVHIVSGDSRQAVEDLAHHMGIAVHNTASRQVPANKVAYVQRLIDGHKTVLFCGDGTNDAAAVARANVGVQIGTNSDLMRATADVVLMGGLDGVCRLLDISKAAYRRIIFNFVWSGVYNLFAILLTAGAFVKFRIPPAYAGLGELVSIMPIIFVTMTMVRMKREHGLSS